MPDRPGGYYIGTDGKPHDAWGKPIVEEEHLTPGPFPEGEGEPVPTQSVGTREEALVVTPKPDPEPAPVEKAVEPVKRTRKGKGK